jgi:uncharacterized protein (DUF2141 family)
MEPQMKRTLLTTCLIAAATILSTHASNANAADVNLTINGVGDKGNVMVALFNKDDKWLGKSTMGTMVAAKRRRYGYVQRFA